MSTMTTTPADADPAVAGPLAGLRVLEMGTIIAGPFAARILADYGADVVTIESARGPPGRLPRGDGGRPGRARGALPPLGARPGPGRRHRDHRGLPVGPRVVHPGVRQARPRAPAVGHPARRDRAVEHLPGCRRAL